MRRSQIFPVRCNQKSTYKASQSITSLCLFMLVSTVLMHSPAYAQSFPYPICHLHETGRVTANCDFKYSVNAPNCKASEWIAFFPLPPELPHQHVFQSKLLVAGINAGSREQEYSPQHRFILSVRVPASTETLTTQLSAEANYSVAISSRELMPGPATLPSLTLTPSERKLFIAPSPTLDFTSSPFQSWIRTNSLIRRTNESDMDFAWRVFTLIRRLYSYKFIADQDRSVSHICQTNASDCGGLSFLFVGVLRANGMQARTLEGRLLKATSLPDSQTSDFGGGHTKSEFYANGLGWIPVEMSGAVAHKSVDPLNYFGRFDADFVTLHIDPDLVVDTIWFGRKSMIGLAIPSAWAFGGGSFEGMKTETIWQTRQISSPSPASH